MGSLFYGCSALKSIDLSQLNTKLVTNMSHLFSRCDSLETINFINNINTSSVVDMSNMFYNCRVLKITELPNFDTKKVTNMSFMFYGCISLESLNLTSFNTPSLLNMKSMFQNNYYLETLDISSFDTKNVITMAYLFAGCGKLKNLYHLSVLNPSPSIDIYGMFDGCYSLFPLGSPDYGESYNGTISDNGSITNKIVLLGFNKYNLISDTKKINFNIFFYSYEYFDYPENLYLSASIIYNSQLRLLQNENSIECLKGEETSNGIEQYGCEIDIENTDIKAINLDETIDFGTETNLVISPLASDYINNLQNLQNIDSYDDLFNNGTIFILENPNLVQNGRRFNISGKMNDDPQLPIGKKITLLVQKEQTKDEIDCNVEDNDITKYTLNCQVINNTISYDLKNSMSVMDNGILLINFKDGNSIINKTDINYSTRRYHSKSNSGISSGAIVAVILCSILALASVIAIIYCSKNNNIKRSAYNNESTSAGIDLNKKI
jgi:surface protein